VKKSAPAKFQPPALDPKTDAAAKNRSQRRAEAKTPKIPAEFQPFVETFNAGLEAQRAGNLALAESHYLRAIEMNPNDAMLLNNFGVCLYEQGKTAQAVEIHRKAIKLDPTRPMAYNNLGVELNALERHEEAVEAFQKAIEIAPINPKAINNLGDSLVKLGRFEDGLAMLDKSILQQRDYVDAHSNRGMALWGLGRIEDAIASFRRALAFNIAHPAVHKNLGMLLLMYGDFANGWHEYEWRWVADKVPERSVRTRWVGEDLRGRTMLLWSEQGVGDEVLHASMVSDLLARGPKLVWECDWRLAPLFQRSYPEVKIVPRRGIASPLPETMTDDITVQSPSASIGRFLRDDISKFHPDRGKYLVADKVRAQALRARIGLKPGEKMVGVSWVSKNLTVGSNKTIPLAQWADILRIPGVRFVDLQYGDTTEERAKLKAALRLCPQHIDGLDLTNDIDGLASLISACDLVLTVSNTTAHLAGALGTPVWVLLPAKLGKFWYWNREGERSLFYSSARILRQLPTEDWSRTLRAAADRLRTYFGIA